MLTSIVKNLSLAAILVSGMALTSCNDDDDDGGGGGTPTQTAAIAATQVDGSTGAETDWSMSNPTAVLNMSGLTITAENAQTGEFIAINVPDFEVGQYTSQGSDISGGSSSYTFEAGGPEYASGTNTEAFHQVTITQADSTTFLISGTFELALFTPISVSPIMFYFENGTFTNVPVEIDIDTGGGGGGGGGGETSFFAKLDGNDYNPAFINAAAQPAIDAIMITAMRSATSAEAINITVADDITPGSYQIGSSTTLIMQYTNPQMVTHLGNSGTLVVESHDQTEKVLIATFEFNAVQDIFQSTPDHVITEGSMTIYY